MNLLGIDDVVRYVELNIGSFHNKRLQNLGELRLHKILKRKNPYLFKAKNILTAQDLVKVLLDAHLSSQEETILGDFLIEPLGHKAKEMNKQFLEAYPQVVNKFTLQFMNEFCEDGKIVWEKLVKFNSGTAG